MEKVELYAIEFESGAGFNIVFNADLTKAYGISDELVEERLKNKGFSEKIAKVSQEYINIIKELALAEIEENGAIEE